jgi:hypothetical protein
MKKSPSAECSELLFLVDLTPKSTHNMHTNNPHVFPKI